MDRNMERILDVLKEGKLTSHHLPKHPNIMKETISTPMSSTHVEEEPEADRATDPEVDPEEGEEDTEGDLGEDSTTAMKTPTSRTPKSDTGKEARRPHLESHPNNHNSPLAQLER